MLRVDIQADEIQRQVCDTTLEALSSRRAFFETRIEEIPTAELAEEAMRRRARWLARPIRDWHRVNRATFFPEGHKDSISQRILSADRYVPRLSMVSGHIAAGLRKAGEEFGEGAESLAEYDVSRLGVNYMKGLRDDPAVIPKHLDVAEERGAVVVLPLQHSVGTWICGSNIQVIFGSGLCRNLQMFQHEHGVESSHLRVSATIADLRV